MDVSEFTVRTATIDDHDDVREITVDTWPDREGDDYLGRVYPTWLTAGDRPKHTLVVEHSGTVVAIAQGVLLTDDEAWGQGLRVHPEYRGQRLSQLLTAALFDWVRDEGASVVRVLVHAWNEAGLGQTRASGYRPAGTFRWVHPPVGSEGRASAHLTAIDRPWLAEVPTASVTADPSAAYRAFQASPGAAVVGGLGLSLDESWALAEVTPTVLARAADETAVFAVRSDAGTTAMSYRSRLFDREDDDGAVTTTAEYGIATWSDLGSAARLLDAIASDAAEAGADRARVAVPDRPRYVSDAALCRSTVAESADVVMAADLTGTTDFDSAFGFEN